MSVTATMSSSGLRWLGALAALSVDDRRALFDRTGAARDVRARTTEIVSRVRRVV